MELRVEVVGFAEAVEVEESAEGGEVGTSRSIGSSVVFAIAVATAIATAVVGCDCRWCQLGAPEKQGSSYERDDGLVGRPKPGI